MPISMAPPVIRPGRAYRPRSRPRRAVSFLIRPHMSATMLLTFVSTAFLVHAWLFGFPDSLESHIPAPWFRVCLCRRFRVLVLSLDTNCTLYGQVMDKCGDHALVCGCGGDTVTGHNFIRNAVHSAATDEASLGAVLQRPGFPNPSRSS